MRSALPRLAREAAAISKAATGGKGEMAAGVSHAQRSKERAPRRRRRRGGAAGPRGTGRAGRGGRRRRRRRPAAGAGGRLVIPGTCWLSGPSAYRLLIDGCEK